MDIQDWIWTKPIPTQPNQTDLDYTKSNSAKLSQPNQTKLIYFKPKLTKQNSTNNKAIHS